MPLQIFVHLALSLIISSPPPLGDLLGSQLHIINLHFLNSSGGSCLFPCLPPHPGEILGPPRVFVHLPVSFFIVTEVQIFKRRHIHRLFFSQVDISGKKSRVPIWTDLTMLRTPRQAVWSKQAINARLSIGLICACLSIVVHHYARPGPGNTWFRELVGDLLYPTNLFSKQD